MIVSGFMQQNPVKVEENQPIRQAVRLIFNLGISAVLVTKNNKLVGIITEEDILQRLFPSVRDFMEDYVHAKSFDLMESKLADILDRPVKDIMTQKVLTVGKDTPIMQVLSTMLVRNFSHMPVVSKQRELIGIVSQGDIFKAIAGSEIPYDSDQEFHDWIARHWDMIQDSRDRYLMEVKSLQPILKKADVQNIVDLGCGTGGHAIGFAREGFEVVGFDFSSRMKGLAVKKMAGEKQAVQKRLAFYTADNYTKALKELPYNPDAIVFMGNALTYQPRDYRANMKAAYHKLRESGVLVLQISNFNKIFSLNRRFQDFTVVPSRLHPNHEYAFLEFYDPPRSVTKTIMFNMAILEYKRERWGVVGVNSTPIAHIRSEDIQKELKSLSFKFIDVYGSQFGKPLFDEAYNPEVHDWMNIIAVK